MIRKTLTLLTAIALGLTMSAHADLGDTKGRAYTHMTPAVRTTNVECWINNSWMIAEIFNNDGKSILVCYYKRHGLINLDETRSHFKRNIPASYDGIEHWDLRTIGNVDVAFSKDYSYVAFNGKAPMGTTTYDFIGYATLEGMAWLNNHPNFIAEAFAETEVNSKSSDL